MEVWILFLLSAQTTPSGPFTPPTHSRVGELDCMLRRASRACSQEWDPREPLESLGWLSAHRRLWEDLFARRCLQTTSASSGWTVRQCTVNCSYISPAPSPHQRSHSCVPNIDFTDIEKPLDNEYDTPRDATLLLPRNHMMPLCGCRCILKPPP